MANSPFIVENKRVMVCGCRDMLGASLIERLKTKNCELLTVSYDDVDLTDEKETKSLFNKKDADAVIMLADRSGGIFANSTRPAEFLHANALIALNTLQAAYETGVQKFVYLANASVYPQNCPQPMKETDMMTGALDPGHIGYGMAKLTGIVAAQCFRKQYGEDNICVVTSKMYGPDDDFDLKNGSVLPSLIRKIHEAKINEQSEVDVWGTGAAMRDFVYVDDVADAVIYLMERYSDAEPVNIGSGAAVSIKELAQTIAKVVGYDGALTFDTTKPEGKPLRQCDISKIREMGWEPKVSLETGLLKTYEWFKQHYDEIKKGK